MLNYFMAIPLFVFSVFGYATQTVCTECMTPTSNLTSISNVETRERQNAAAATASAEAFAERVATLEQLTESSTLSTTDAVVLRSTITDRFHEAFTVITHLEESGRFADAVPAREIMQVSIDNYMHTAPESTPEITRDLETFSKFMTETLIDRSVKATL